MIENGHKRFKRTRQHLSSQHYIAADELKVLPEHYPPLINYIDWGLHFGNGLPPDCIDLGCGKGSFMIEHAKSYPNLNILGIEVKEYLTREINEIATQMKLSNCSALWYSLANGLKFIADSSVLNIYYLFPDPWFKRKHFKRRVFNSKLINELLRILKPGAELRIASDVEELEPYHQRLLRSSGAFEINTNPSNEQWAIPQTDREVSCIGRGKVYSRWICKKIN